MSKPLFRSGGPLNIRRVSGDRYTANITLSPDEDGLLARSCADSACAPGYFKVKTGTGITTGQERAYCPYCAKPAPLNDFATPAQIEYAKALMLEEAKDGVNRLVKDSMGLDANGRRQLSSGFISMEMRFEPLRKRHVNRPVEEELRRDLTCPHCGLVHAVFGLAFTCPDAAVTSSSPMCARSCRSLRKSWVPCPNDAPPWALALPLETWRMPWRMWFPFSKPR